MNQKQYIGQKIKELREGKLRVTSDRLGSMLNPPKSGKTILSWEHGRTQPDGDTLINLCMIFGVDIAEFYEKTPEYHSAVGDETWTDIPLYGSIAAGTPIEMIPVEEHHAVPAVMHDRYPNAFLLEVKGRSMDRVLPDGCFAMIDPTDEVTDGKAYAICVNGNDATIKRVRKLENGFELAPDSTDPTFKPKIYDYGEQNTEEVTVIGRVVFYVLPYDFEI